MGLQALQDVQQRIEQATTPEALFQLSPDAAADLEQAEKSLTRQLRAFSYLAHPDRYQPAALAKPGAAAPVLADPSQEDAFQRATTTFPRLYALFRGAMRKLERGTYGDLSAPYEAGPEDSTYQITSMRGTWNITWALAQGELSTVYGGHRGDDVCDRVVLKLVDDASNNARVQNEVRLLRLLSTERSPLLKHLPEYLDQFKTGDGRQGIVLRHADGVDLEAVREVYPEGIPQEHCFWILRRVLSVLGYAHKKGIMHGHITPAHILVRPYDHNVWLVDWSYGIVNPAHTGETFLAWDERYSAPEVQEGGKVLSSADLYALAKCMVFALGGDPRTATFPPTVDIRLVRFLQFFLRPSPLQRARDPWEMFHKVEALRKEIYGPHRFLPFALGPYSTLP